MGLATSANVYTYTGIPSGTADALVTAHLATAEARVKERIGATIYTAITAAAGAPYTAAVKTAVTRAESLLCGALVLRGYLNQISKGGMVMSVITADGTESRLASQAQLEAKAAAWEADGLECLGPWETLYQEELRDAGSELAQPAHTRRVGRLTFTAVGAGMVQP